MRIAATQRLILNTKIWLSMKIERVKDRDKEICFTVINDQKLDTYKLLVPQKEYAEQFVEHVKKCIEASVPLECIESLVAPETLT